MSLDPEPPRPPRKPRPKPPGSPAPDPTGEPSAFRANPQKASGARARSRDPRASEGGTERGSGEAPGWWERIVFGRVGTGQLAVFCRQLASYLKAGVDIHKSLVSLQGQFARTALGPVTGRLALAVKRGETLTDAFAREPQAFDSLFLSMIRVAETRGGVPETLRNLSKHYEARQRLIRQARSAMIYPVAVLLVASLVVALLTVFILPMLAPMLREIAGRGGDGELPLPSRALLALSDFMRVAGWFAMPLAFFGTPFVLFRLYRTAAGKAAMDRIGLRLPVFGPLLRKLDISRFARTLASLLEAGVDINASLALTGDVLRLEPFKDAIRDSREHVLHGEELSVALNRTRLFGPDVIAVLDSGEETGKLPEALDHLADDYEEQVEYTVKNLGQLVQPLMMIGLGGVVLFIILAVLLPYIAMINNLSR